MSDTANVFIIHSKADTFEKALTEQLVETLLRLGISVYEYGDWIWSREQPGKVRYRSSGKDLDIARFMSGHPEPFRVRQMEEVVDRRALEDMLAAARVTLFIAPRSGAMSSGVQEEFEALPHDCSMMLAIWGDQNEWLVEQNRHTYLYRLTRARDPDVERAALDLTHLLWLHWNVDFLGREGRAGGHDLLQILARQQPAVRRLIKFSGRSPETLRRQVHAQEERPADHAQDADAIRLLGQSLAVADARRMAACLWQQMGVRYVLDRPPSEPVADLLRAAKHTFEWFGKAVLDAHPELADESAAGLRIGAALAAGAWDRADFAEQLLNSALASRRPATARTAPPTRRPISGGRHEFRFRL